MRSEDALKIAYSRYHPEDNATVKAKLDFERYGMLGYGSFSVWRCVYCSVSIVRDFEILFKITPMRLFKILEKLYHEKDEYFYHYTYKKISRPDKRFKKNKP